jgi:hypothetical protein
MQIQYYVAIALIIVLALGLMLAIKAARRISAHQFHKGLSTGRARGDARYNALQNDLSAMITRHEEEKDRLRTEFTGQQDRNPTLNPQDLQMLYDIVITLKLARETWQPMTGAQPWTTRATAQIEHLNTIANRVLSEIKAQDVQRGQAAAPRAIA